jgi:hypothetical protein
MPTQLAYKCVPAREKIRITHNPCADSAKPMLQATQFCYNNYLVQGSQRPSEYIYMLVTGASTVT